MKEVKITEAREAIELTLKMRELSERINNPQDLNDALLAVQVDEHAGRVFKTINGDIAAFAAKCLGVPWDK